MRLPIAKYAINSLQSVQEVLRRQLGVRNAMVELTRENFDELVTHAEGAVLVDFWSPGCGPCRMMEPVLESVAARHPEVRFAKLNAAEFPDIAWAFEAVSVPTFVLFRDGVPVDDIVGAVPAQRIGELLAPCPPGAPGSC